MLCLFITLRALVSLLASSTSIRLLSLHLYIYTYIYIYISYPLSPTQTCLPYILRLNPAPQTPYSLRSILNLGMIHGSGIIDGMLALSLHYIQPHYSTITYTLNMSNPHIPSPITGCHFNLSPVSTAYSHVLHCPQILFFCRFCGQIDNWNHLHLSIFPVGHDVILL